VTVNARFKYCRDDDDCFDLYGTNSCEGRCRLTSDEICELDESDCDVAAALGSLIASGYPAGASCPQCRVPTAAELCAQRPGCLWIAATETCEASSTCTDDGVVECVREAIAQTPEEPDPDAPPGEPEPEQSTGCQQATSPRRCSSP